MAASKLTASADITKNLKDFNIKNMEKEVKSHSNWTKKDWEGAGMQNNRFHKFISFIKFWSIKLKEAFADNVVIFTLFNDSREAFINTGCIIDFLETLIPLSDILGIFQLRNNRLLGIEFKNSVTKKKVIENIHKFEDSFLVDLEWARDDGQVDLTLHWLPSNISMEKVSPHLINYMSIDSIDIETSSFNKKFRVKTGKIHIHGTLKENIVKDNIPHLVTISGLQSLITVKGRAPLCLICERVGHIAINCPTPFCRTCRKILPKTHICNLEAQITTSYARKLAPDNTEYTMEEDSTPPMLSQPPTSTDSYNADDKQDLRKIKSKLPTLNKDIPIISSDSLQIIEGKGTQVRSGTKLPKSITLDTKVSQDISLIPVLSAETSSDKGNLQWADQSSCSDLSDTEKKNPYKISKANYKKKRSENKSTKAITSKTHFLRTYKTIDKQKKNIPKSQSTNSFDILNDETMDTSTSTPNPNF